MLPGCWYRLLLAIVSLAAGDALADGCFVWHKGADLNEPSQKAVIFWNGGRETLVLQVKYEGPAEDFAWIVPLPAKPEVAAIQPEKDPFAEISLYTQQRLRWRYRDTDRTPGLTAVTVLERKVVGVYDVAVLGAEDAAALADWLNRNGYTFPTGRKDLLEHYTKKKWVYVAMRIDPRALAKEEVKRLKTGELQPIRFTFAADKLVYPLRISSANAGPTELLLYLLADAPMVVEGKEGPSRFPIEENMARLGDEQSVDIKHGTYRKATSKELPLTWESLGLDKDTAFSLCKYRTVYRAEEMTDDLAFVPFQPAPYWEARLEREKQWVQQLAILELLARPDKDKYGKRLRALQEERASSRDPLDRTTIAGWPSTPAELLVRLAGDQDPYVRARTAGNPGTPVDTLKRLRQDPDRSVRHYLAFNKSATAEILKELAHDSDLGVVSAAAAHRGFPFHTLRDLARSQSPEVRAVAAQRARGPVVDLLEVLATDNDAEVRVQVAMNENTPAGVLAVLAKDKQGRVREAVGGNYGTPAGVLVVLATDADAAVRKRVANTIHTPRETLLRLAQDREGTVAEAARQNLKGRGPAASPTAPPRISTAALSVPVPALELAIVTNVDELPIRMSSNKDGSEIFVARKRGPTEITSFGVFVFPRELKNPGDLQNAKTSFSFAVNGPVVLDKHPLSLAVPEEVRSAQHAYCFVIVKNSDLRSVEYLISLKTLSTPTQSGPDVDSKPAAQADRATRISAVIVACLHKIRKGVEALVQKYPEDLAHLGQGVIDEQDLSLAFPITDPRKRIRQLPKEEDPFARPTNEGLSVRFVLPLPGTAPQGSGVHCWWPYCNVGFVWSWAWAGAFPAAAQQEFGQVLEDALRPLDEIENGKIAGDLAGRGNASHVLRGTPGIVLTAKVSKVAPDGHCIVELHENNLTGKAVALCPGRGRIIQDGKIRRLSSASYLMTPIDAARSADQDPFVYLKPGESKCVSTLSLGQLAAGTHQIRVAWRHASDGWLDVRPMAADAPPVLRKVENAWTGVVISDVLAVDAVAARSSEPPSASGERGKELMAAGPPGPLANVARRNLEARGTVKGEQATAEALKGVQVEQGGGKPLESLSPKLHVRYAHSRLCVNLAGPSEGLSVTWPLPKDIRSPLRESIDPNKDFPKVFLYRGNDMEKYLAPSGAEPFPRAHETAVAGTLECEPGTKDKTVKLTLKDLRFQTVTIPQIGPFDVELHSTPAP